MKKNITFILSILFSLAILTGCSFTENKEKKLCNKINNDISEYRNNKASFEILVNKIKSYYDEECINSNNSDICTRMKSLINRQNINYNLEDCNTYPEGNLKDLCNSRNEATKSLINNKDQYDSSSVDILSKK